MLNRQIRIIKNLIFSFKKVFSSSPYDFITIIFINIYIVTTAYVLLFIGKEILDCIGFSLANNLDLRQSLVEVGIWVVLSAIILFSTTFSKYYSELKTEKQQLKFGQYVDKEMTMHVLKLDLSYFDDPNFYDKINSALNGKSKLNFLVHRVIFFMMNLISVITAAVIACKLVNPFQVILLATMTLPTMFSRGKYRVKHFEYENNNQKLNRQISYLGMLTQAKETAKEIRFFGIEDFLVGKYITKWREYYAGMRKITIKSGILDALFPVFPYISIALSVYTITLGITNGNIGIGSFSYLMGVLLSLKSSLINLVEDISRLEESEAAICAYKTFMEMTPIIHDDGQKILEYIELIEFKDVFFRYPNTNHNVLDGMSFVIKGKEKVALVGSNGAGKTTVIKLLLRFYEADAGEILINGINLMEYSLESLKRAFSVVFQDYMTYSMSIRENVAISCIEGKNDVSKIYGALEFAELEDLVKDRQFALDTYIGRDFSDDGIELSGGQRQKLAIARCAFRPAKFLLLDEPDASLDPVAEDNILSKMSELSFDKGLIFISHRLTNTTLMDRILLIENGKIVEEGSHTQLYKSMGKYHTLFNIQTKKYA